jgi:hypothetical protein
MKTQFFDRQDPNNPANGRMVNNSAELRSILMAARKRHPFFAELIGENGFKLLLGLGGNQGSAQFSSVDGSPPYLMAIASDGDDADEASTFLISDTLTPVPKRYCLPYEAIMDIAEAFVQTGRQKPDIYWEEI